MGVSRNAVAVLLSAIAAFGCRELLMSKEDRQRIDAIKAAVKADPGSTLPTRKGSPRCIAR